MDFYTLLLNNQSAEFEKTKQSYGHEFEDNSINDLYKKVNGGGFFSNSFVIYPSYSDGVFFLKTINNTVNAKYAKYAGECAYWGCDIFGNQYGFNNKKVIMLNIESASIELLADSFEAFMVLLSQDIEFYTGEPFAKLWNEKHAVLIQPDRRLCPVHPFVLGGAYSIDNMYELSLFDVLDYNENIASQIFDLPDGTNIEIRLTK